MRGKNEFVETYVLEPGQTFEDLPAYFRDVILPESEIEATALIYKDSKSIHRFHVIQKVKP